MPKTLQLIHSCDHTVLINNDDETTRLITRSSGYDYDILIDDRTIRSISAVSQEIDGETVVYQEGVDYTLYTHNKIRWIGENPPSTGSEYEATFVTDVGRAQLYKSTECPRCGGSGWYVDILTNISQQVGAISGSMKLIQDITKLLLTRRDARGYGTNLMHDVVGKPIYNRSSTITVITSEIMAAENKYKDIQTQAIANGLTVPDDERLLAIEIQSIDIDQESLSARIELVLHSYMGESLDVTLTL